MKNRILKYTGYILFGILLFVLLVYVRFPRESVKEWIITSFENSFSYNLAIKDLHPLFPVGLDFRDIEITANRAAKTMMVMLACQRRSFFSSESLSGCSRALDWS